jgi:hypothetical protein
MSVSLSSILSLLPVFAIVAISLLVAAVLARGDDRTALRSRRR